MRLTSSFLHRLSFIVECPLKNSSLQFQKDDDDAKDSDDINVKAKNVPGDTRREHTLVMRLTNKEQELQECMVC